MDIENKKKVSESDTPKVIQDLDTNYIRPMVNHGFPKDSEVGITDMNVRYIQRNDTLGDSDNYQQMNLQTEALEFNKEENVDSFIRMSIGPKTPDEVDIEPFWSINGLEDLAQIFNNFEKRRGSTIHYKVVKEVTYPDGTVHTGVFE